MSAGAGQLPLSSASLMADHNPFVRDLVERLRLVVRRAVPGAVEKANRGWHSLNFSHPAVGYFCGLFPRQADVVMAFEFGALLPDPDGLLTGDTRQVRFMVVRRKRDIRVRALTRLLRAAVEGVPASREARLALVRAGAKPIPDRRKA